MLGLTCLIAGLAIGQTQNDGSLYSRLFPAPSGKNGYEEYVMAGDVVNTNRWSVYEEWLGYLLHKKQGVDPSADEDAPALPPYVTPKMCDLDVRRIMDDLFGSAVHLVSAGNRKPVTDPHSNYNAETTFPELAPFKMIAKVDINRAHVEFSDGRSGAAVKDLLEGLKFTYNIFGTTRISTLVSVAAQAIVLSEFERELSQLSLEDAKEIDKQCKTLLDRPLPISDVIKREYASTMASLDMLLDKPQELFDPGLGEQGQAAMFQNLSPSDRQQIKSMVTQSLASKFSAEAARYEGPEFGWLDRDESADPTFSLNDHTPSNLAAILSEALLSNSLERQYSRAVARGRIQLRLLRLHAQVIEFKWLHYRLPDTLKECAYDHAEFDPVANEDFHYERTDGGYRLYSQGVAGFGRIELRYRAQAGTSAAAAGSNVPPALGR